MNKPKPDINLEFIAAEILYDIPFIKRTGPRKGRSYSEIYAEEILAKGIHKKILNEISFIKENDLRADGYFCESHKPQNIEFNIKQKRREPNIARWLYANSSEIDGLGKVVEYEIPLIKKIHKNIDLITVNEAEKSINLIELKSDENAEGLLRGILEIATYYQLLNIKSFRKSFAKIYGGAEGFDIKKIVAVFDGTKAGELALNLENCPNLRTLIAELDINIFVFESNLPKLINQASKINLKLAKKIILH